MPITLQASVQARHWLEGLAVANSKASNAACAEACSARRVGFVNAILHKMLPSS